MALGDRIALARKKAGLSQEQLGEKLGVSRQAVSKWESGQTNPDVTYVARMCRLLEASSDWLLLGEEETQTAPPVLCPDCQAVVSERDHYCPACGRDLRGGASKGYTILLKEPGAAYPPTEDLVHLSGSGLFPQGSPLQEPITYSEAKALIASAPQVLAKGLSGAQARSIWNAAIYPNRYLLLQDSQEEDPRVLANCPGIDPIRLAPVPRREPMSFGKVVLACVLGFLGALFLLPLLINMLGFMFGFFLLR